MFKPVATTFSLSLVLLLTGCGPTISKKIQYEWKPYDANESKQTKEGITVEDRNFTEFPPTFFAQVQDCTTQGVPMVDQYGKPRMAQARFYRPGQLWYQVALTNNTGHVIRLNSAIMRLFDPAGNQYEPLSKDDLAAEFQASWPCPSATQAVNSFKLIKMLDRNNEILPDTTITGWLAFRPASETIPGTWRLAFYEMPVLTDEAGKVTKTTKFEVRTLRKKFEQTFRQEGMFDTPKLIETRELTD